MTTGQRKAHKAGNKQRKELILDIAHNLPKDHPDKALFCTMRVGQN